MPHTRTPPFYRQRGRGDSYEEPGYSGDFATERRDHDYDAPDPFSMDKCKHESMKTIIIEVSVLIEVFVAELIDSVFLPPLPKTLTVLEDLVSYLVTLSKQVNRSRSASYWRHSPQGRVDAVRAVGDLVQWYAERFEDAGEARFAKILFWLADILTGEIQGDHMDDDEVCEALDDVCRDVSRGSTTLSGGSSQRDTQGGSTAGRGPAGGKGKERAVDPRHTLRYVCNDEPGHVDSTASSFGVAIRTKQSTPKSDKTPSKAKATTKNGASMASDAAADSCVPGTAGQRDMQTNIQYLVEIAEIQNLRISRLEDLLETEDGDHGSTRSVINDAGSVRSKMKSGQTAEQKATGNDFLRLLEEAEKGAEIIKRRVDHWTMIGEQADR